MWMASTPGPFVESRSIAQPAETRNGVPRLAPVCPGVSMLIAGLPGGRTEDVAAADASNAPFSELWA